MLKNGGYLRIRMPNRWGYAALAASLIPNKFHSKVTSVVQDGRKEEDVFPTLYQCNSISKLRGAMQKIGFVCAVQGYEAERLTCHFQKSPILLVSCINVSHLAS